LKGQFITNIFNKVPNDIVIDDIKDFFSTQQEETSILEFKAGQIEIIDLYKEITAFLNTEGGLIIIGSPKEVKKIEGKIEKRYCQGDLTYSSFKGKDWLSQKIYSNIVPSPVNLTIVEFITQEGSVFLIDVPQSNNPPHQSVVDGRYYIRLETEAKPAAHGLIQALFNKRRAPELKADISLRKDHLGTNTVTISFGNNAPYPADKVGFLIDVYNVEEADSGFNVVESENEFRKYSFTKSNNSLLVRLINIQRSFKIYPKKEGFKKQNYLIMAAYWCVDADIDFTFWTCNPVTLEVVNSGKLDSVDFTINDALRLISNPK